MSENRFKFAKKQFAKVCQICQNCIQSQSQTRTIPRERCKGVHFVDLGESFPTHLYLQNLASIQTRTSPTKFGRSPRRAAHHQHAATISEIAWPHRGTAPSPAASSVGRTFLLASHQRHAKVNRPDLGFCSAIRFLSGCGNISSSSGD